MNTTKLSKHYGSLSVLQRLKLIHAAARRGDEAEIRSIDNACPCRYSKTDTGRLEALLRILSVLHQYALLEICAEIWHARTQWFWALDKWASAEPLDADSDSDEDNVPECNQLEFWWYSTKLLEARFIIEKEGWELFITQSGLDLSRIELMEPSWLIEFVSENAAIDADTQDALKWLTKNEESKLRTSESIAGDWAAVFSKMLKVEVR